MSRVLIRTGALRHNFRVIDDWMNRAGVSWTLVSKVLCGNRPVLELLYGLGVRSFGESRLENIDEMPPLGDDAEIWYLRGPEASQVEQVVGDLGLLGGCGFGRTHAHPPVELAGIDVDHLELQLLGQGDSKRRLATGGGAQHHDHQGMMSCLIGVVGAGGNGTGVAHG